MKDIKYPPVANIKGINVPFILIERAFSVPFYALLNSKTVSFELGHDNMLSYLTILLLYHTVLELYHTVLELYLTILLSYHIIL